MAMQRVAGTAYVKVDGDQLALRGSLTIRHATPEREEITGMDGVHGFSEKLVAPGISGDFTTTAELDVIALANASNMTITAELANGKSYVLSGAVLKNRPEENAGDGQVSLDFIGDSLEAA